MSRTEIDPGAVNADQAQADSGFGQLGFTLFSELLPAVLAASEPVTAAPEQPAAATPAPAQSRRERRERERAEAGRDRADAPFAPPASSPPLITQTEEHVPVLRDRSRAGRRRADSTGPRAVRSRRVGTAEALPPQAPGPRPVREETSRTAPAEKPRAERTRRRPTAPVRIRKRRAGRPTKRALLSKLMSVGAMIGAAAMMVATTVPANAFYSADTATHSPLSAVQPVQTLSISADADTASAISRDTYTVSSPADEIRFKFGNRSFSYTNDPTGTIQWPFAVAVPISSGFGARSAPCGGCSSYHEGLDFVPGAGAPIQSIADGVVSLVDVSNTAYGNHVVVDHVINGQKVQSVYAHMRYGSIRVAEGQHVKVGDILGLVGNTGESTGPHLHLEIHLDGVPVDPFAWLKANAN